MRRTKIRLPRSLIPAAVEQNPWPRATDGLQACVDADPRLFDEVPAEGLNGARRFCAECPARADCLMLGKIRKETGVWGGILLREGQEAPTMNHVRAA